MLGTLTSSASALPEDFYGMTWNGDLVQSEDDWDAMQKSGAKVFRIGLHWGWVTHNTGDEYDWAVWDTTFRLAAERDMTVFINLVGDLNSTPRFPAKSEYEGWEDFVYESVRRYGYGGDFWDAHPSLPYKPVTMWEIWPEANIAGANPIISKAECEEISQSYVPAAETCVQPHAYGELLKISAVAIEEAHFAYAPSSPQPEVIFSGLAPHELLYPESEELGFGSLLEESAEVPGVAASFDSYGIHPYAFYGNQIENLKEDIQIARKQLDDLGLLGKSISITEIGWPVDDAELKPGEPGFTEAEQALLVEEGFDWIKEEAEDLDIRSLVYYSNRDRPFADTWDSFSGLRDRDAENRPAWTAFREETGAEPWLPEAVTKRATDIADQTATLTGVVNGHGFDTSYHFEYLDGTAYEANGQSFSGPHSPAETVEATVGAQAKTVNEMLNDLESGLYYYRLTAANGEGEVHGSIRSFKVSGWRVDDTYNNTSGGANDNRFTDISCTSQTFCIATTNLIYGSWTYGYVEKWDGEGWSILSGLPSNSRVHLSGVSCTSPSHCVVVGDHADESGEEHSTLAWHWDGEEWTKETTVDGVGADDNRFTDVSCASEDFCVATGNLLYNWSYGYTNVWDGEQWSFSGTPGNTRIHLQGVSCSTETDCVAVGHYSDESGKETTTRAYRWDGEEWTKEEALAKGSSSRLIGISCPSLCGAVGYYVNGSGTWTLAERYLQFSPNVFLVGEESESKAEQPQIEADEPPLTIAGLGTSSFSIAKGAPVKCENADFEAELANATATLPFSASPQDGSCSLLGLPALVKTNGCRYVLGILNSGPPYVANLDIDCDKAGESLEYRVYINQEKVEEGEPFCTVRIPAQEGVEGVALENVSEGTAQGVALDIEADGIIWSRSGGCGEKSNSDGVWTGSAVLTGVG